MGDRGNSAEIHETNANTCRSIANGLVGLEDYINGLSPHNQERVAELYKEGEQHARALARIFTSLAAIELSEREDEESGG